MATLAHVSNYFATAPSSSSPSACAGIAGAATPGRVYFCNSGAEANEAAFKLARLNRPHGTKRVLP